MELVFASNNKHKIEEINAILVLYDIQVKSMAEIGFTKEIEETGLTFKENAAIKVRAIYDFANVNCFADDSGLEVEALNNEPGVFSARYASLHGDHAANNQKLLENLKNQKNRKACFKTVIALILKGEIHYFEGRVDGIISESLRGTTGFGYDPLFIPTGYDKTFAEMTSEQKNQISHRKWALEGMLGFLRG